MWICTCEKSWTKNMKIIRHTYYIGLHPTQSLNVEFTLFDVANMMYVSIRSDDMERSVWTKTFQLFLIFFLIFIL